MEGTWQSRNLHQPDAVAVGQTAAAGVAAAIADAFVAAARSIHSGRCNVLNPEQLLL